LPPTDSNPGLAPVYAFLRDPRLGQLRAQAWVVGRPADWDAKGLWSPFSLLPADDQPLARQVRTFAVWARLGQDVDLGAGFDCVDAGAARTLAERFQQRVPHVNGPGAKGEPTETWVSLESQTSAQAIRQALGQMRPGFQKP
jgi:hypothetical protein